MSTRTDHIVRVRKVLHSSRGRYEFGSTELTYSYGSPLRVGDRVMCPGNEYSGPFLAEVVGLGSDYDGFIRPLLCRVAPDRKRP